MYALFTLLNVYYSVMAILDKEMAPAIWAVTVTVLYFLYTVALFLMTSSATPSRHSLYMCTSALVLLIAFSITQLVFSLYNNPTDYFGLLHIIGIAVELSTLYIHYHLEKKLREISDVSQDLLNNA